MDNMFSLFDALGIEAPKEENTGDDTAKKPSSKKGKSAGGTKKSPGMVLKGPVTVVGTGWTYPYGETGKAYTVAEIVKEVIDAGYKDAAVGRLYTAGENMLLVNSLGMTATPDDQQIGKEITIAVGQYQAIYKTEDFDGMDEDEVSVFDLTQKYIETHPEFTGCSLAMNVAAGVATPVFPDEMKKKDVKGEIPLWTPDGVRKVDVETLQIDDAELVLYQVGENYFATYTSNKSTSVGASDLGLQNKSTKEAKEKYTLPFTIYLGNFGTRHSVTAEDFGGKEKVDKDAVVEFLKPKYKFFQSDSRKIDVIYDKRQNVVSVALISGKKGGGE